jgi:hypothetical protein
MIQKIFLAFLLVWSLSVSSCYRSAYDDPADFYVENAKDGKSLVIFRYKGQKLTNISVPPRINNKPVTEIFESAFADIEIISLIIPSGIKKIGDWAFSGNFLKDFTIPKTVTEIGAGAFMDNRLTAITIPGSVRKIGYRAFTWNPLTSITIGKDVELETISGYDEERDEKWVYYAFELGLETEFDEFYKANGKKAGTYILKDGAWSMK